MRASFVIPCYQSTGVLENLVSDLVVAARDARHCFEVILVQDSGDSETSIRLESLGREFPEVRVIVLSRNFGQQGATIAGIIESCGDIIVTLDDDYQHRPSDALKMIGLIVREPNIRLIYAKPLAPSHSTTRVVSGKLFRKALKLSGLKFAEHLSPFRAFRGYFREAFRSAQGPNVSVDVVLSWVTDNPRAIEIEFNQRTDGKSGYKHKELIKLAVSILLTQTTSPLRVGVYLGILGVVASLVYGLFLLGTYLLGGIEVPGFATTILLILLLGSLQLVVLGIIGIYVGQQHRRGMHQPAFFIENSRADDAWGR